MLDLSEISTQLSDTCDGLNRVGLVSSFASAVGTLRACSTLPEACLALAEYNEQAAPTQQLNSVQTLQNIQVNFSVLLAVQYNDAATLATQRDCIVAALTDFEATGMEIPCYFTGMELAQSTRFFDLWRLKFFTGYSNQSIFN
jgi:hypothetical protein